MEIRSGKSEKLTMMMMMCNDLMCTEKPARGQLSLHYSTRVETDICPRK